MIQGYYVVLPSLIRDTLNHSFIAFEHSNHLKLRTKEQKFKQTSLKIPLNETSILSFAGFNSKELFYWQQHVQYTIDTYYAVTL